MKFHREVPRCRLSIKIPKTSFMSIQLLITGGNKVSRKWKLKEDFIRSIFLVRPVV